MIIKIKYKGDERCLSRSTSTPAGRFAGIKRDYTLDQVKALSGSIRVEYSLARQTAEKMWSFFTAKTMSTPLGR